MNLPVISLLALAVERLGGGDVAGGMSMAVVAAIGCWIVFGLLWG